MRSLYTSRSRQHDRRRRHQPDRLHVAARQRHHLERRCRRASRDGRSPTCRSDNGRRSAPIRPRSAHGSSHPDPWVSLRVSQAWGRASIAVIGQQERRRPTTRYTAPRLRGCARRADTTLCGYPGDEWGWAVLGRRRDQARLAEPGQPRRLLRHLWRRRVPHDAPTARPARACSAPATQVAFGVSDRRGLRQRLGTGADHDLDGRRRLRILLDPQLLEHDLRRLHPTSVQQHRDQRPLVLRWRRLSAVHHRRRRRAIRASALAGRHASRLVPAAGSAVCGRRAVHRRRVGHVAGQTITLDQRRTGARPTGAYTVKDLGIISVMFRAQRSWGAD